MATVLGEVIL